MPYVQDWFPYRRSTGVVELFAFPHAGAASTVFNGLREQLRHNGIGLSAAVLPGRGRRVRQAPHRRMADLLAEFEAVARADEYAAFQGDYALLGSCSGALVAYEVAKLLVQAPCANPRLLVVCSCMPPRGVFDTGMGRLPTAELLGQTASMGGTAPQLMQDADFVAILERALRADWEIYDGYQYRPAEPLPVPILAVRGAEDTYVDAVDLGVWREQTSEEFRLAQLDSGHWALDAAGTPTLAGQIAAALAAAPSARPRT
jgi:surfactin synthase thioesterase subunit